MTLRERLLALAEGYKLQNFMGVTGYDHRGIALAAARMALEDATRICDEYPSRDPAEDGNGYWAAENCAAAIRALHEGLEKEKP